MNAHEIFSDANRKAHLQPARFTPQQIAELELIAAEGREIEEDEDGDC